MPKPAIFLDRDGVIIENRPDYVRNWADVEILKPALDALVWLSDQPYLIVIVTNQSAVGRQIISQNQAEEINRHLIEKITTTGGRIDAVFMCPHAPSENCACRKPKPGLIQQAALELQIDLKNSIMIGDAMTDIQAGERAGVGKAALVLTGRGQTQLSMPDFTSLASFQIQANLLTAVEAFTGQSIPGKQHSTT